MPDIQAGDVEITQVEALMKKSRALHNEDQDLQVDELGEKHEESALNHLGRS